MNLGTAVVRLILVGVIVFGCLSTGSFYIIRSVLASKKAKQSQTWPSVPGRVLKSCVFERRLNDNDGGTTIWYDPHIEYDYQVSGTRFTSERLFIGPKVTFRKLDTSQDVINHLTDGKTVTVFFNPDDPSDAVLEQRLSGDNWLITGIILIFFGLFILPFFINALGKLF